MKYQEGDHVLWHGFPCTVETADKGWCAWRRDSDSQLFASTNAKLDEHQGIWQCDSKTPWHMQSDKLSSQHNKGEPS